MLTFKQGKIYACQNKVVAKNSYPNYCNEQTRVRDNSYPIYRRRHSEMSVNTSGSALDNKWVVAYSPYMLAKYLLSTCSQMASNVKLLV